MITVQVKAKHIRYGLTNNSYNCPIALALHEQFDGGDPLVSIRVHSDVVNVGYSDYKLPRSAKRFIKRFDQLGKKAVKPFNFRLDYTVA